MLSTVCLKHAKVARYLRQSYGWHGVFFIGIYRVRRYNFRRKRALESNRSWKKRVCKGLNNRLQLLIAFLVPSSSPNTIQYNTIQHNTTDNTIQYNGNAMQCNTMHCIVSYWIVLFCIVLYCISFHCYCTVLYRFLIILSECISKIRREQARLGEICQKYGVRSGEIKRH